MKYSDFFSECLRQISEPVGNYSDFSHLDTTSQIKGDDTVCQVCGATGERKAENVGFNEPGADHIEIEFVCPNGCNKLDADERVVLL